MARKSNRNNKGPKEERIPREPEVKEPEIVKVLKNEAFLAFLKEHPKFANVMDSSDWDENLQNNILTLYHTWDLAGFKPEEKPEEKDQSKEKGKVKEIKLSLAKKVQDFYTKTISAEMGIQLSAEDLKAIDSRLLQEIIDVSNSAPDKAEDFAAAMKFVETDLENFHKFDKFPQKIKEKQIEIITKTVGEKKLQEEKNKNVADEKQELQHQLELRKKNLKLRIENAGWLNPKNFPILGRMFWDEDDKYVMKKSVAEWEQETSEYLSKIRKIREEESKTLAGNPERIDQEITEMKAELSSLQSQVAAKKSEIRNTKVKNFLKVFVFGILGYNRRDKDVKDKEKSLEEMREEVKRYQDLIAQTELQRNLPPPEKIKSPRDTELETMKAEYQELKEKFANDFFLSEDIYELVKSRLNCELASFLNSNNNSGLDQAQAKYEALVNKKTGQIPPEYFAEIQDNYIEKLDDAISARFYADCKKQVETFIFSKDSGINKLKEVMRKYFERNKLGSKGNAAARQILGEVLYESLSKCKSAQKRLAIKTLGLQLGFNLSNIDEYEEEEEVVETKPQPEIKDLSAASNAIIERVNKRNKDFLDGLAAVVTFDELIKLVQDSPLQIFNFKKKPFSKKDLAFNIINVKNEKNKEKQLAKINTCPEELQAKLKELISGKPMPKIETKPEPPAPKPEEDEVIDLGEIIPEKPAEIKPEPVTPEEKTVPEEKPEKPAKPEVAAAEIKPEPVKKEKTASAKKEEKPAEPELTAAEEKKPEPPKYEILEDEDPAVALADKIKAIRNSDNEISAKLLVAEAGELLKKYLSVLKSERKINNNLYKELSKTVKKELGKIKSPNPQQMATDVENIFNSIKLQAEAKPKEAKVVPKKEAEPAVEQPAESDAALNQEEQAQEIIEGIKSAQEVEEIIDYLKTVPKVVDAEGREMSGQEMATKIVDAVMVGGIQKNMDENILPSNYGLRDKIIELLGL